ncbi:MAG: hypothetical protein HN348_08355 [Proteobacteria bacterium]|nr:hypothetical protein [Pseudomonadota bacterium]
MLFLLLVFGCGGSERVVERAPMPFLSPFVDTPNLDAPAQVAEIVVINDTTAALSFNVTYGLHQPFLVAPLEAELGLVSLNGKKHMCDCQCGKGRCVECEEPRTELKTVNPGESWAFDWSGKLQSYRTDDDNGWCFDAFAAPAGPYLFKVMKGTAVGRARVVLPTKEKIELRVVEEEGKLTKCPLGEGMVERVARASLERLRRKGGFDERLKDCRVEDAVCVLPDEVEAEKKKRQSSACSVLAVPRGELEVLVYLPLPPDTVGGDVFSHFFDVDGTRVHRVVYTQ